MNAFLTVPQFLKKDYHVIVTSMFERTPLNFGYNFNKTHSHKCVFYTAKVSLFSSVSTSDLGLHDMVKYGNYSLMG